jgi:tetratricopeptide (TPR) repeat protein
MGASYSAAYDTWSQTPAHSADHFVPAQLGGFLHDNGLYGAAEPLLRRALKARERVLGPEHTSTLTSVNNLAGLLESKGDYAGAQPLYERALAASERVLGPDHPDTLTYVNNLAFLLDIKNDLRIEHNLADFFWMVLLESNGDYAGAQPLYERALAASERVLGPDHPATLASVANLAIFLHGKCDNVGAQPLYERALAASERVLGPDHPATLASVANLAVLLDSKCDDAGAQPLYERALESRERVLGPDHPATLASVADLARFLYNKCDDAGAQPLFERALESRERVLGPDHPATLASAEDLGRLLHSKCDYAGARPLMERFCWGDERFREKNESFSIYERKRYQDIHGKFKLLGCLLPILLPFIVCWSIKFSNGNYTIIYIISSVTISLLFYSGIEIFDMKVSIKQRRRELDFFLDSKVGCDEKLSAEHDEFAQFMLKGSVFTAFFLLTLWFLIILFMLPMIEKSIIGLVGVLTLSLLGGYIIAIAIYNIYKRFQN